MILDQVEARAALTGRKRSREASHLISMAFRKLDEGAAEVIGRVHNPKRICVWLPADLLERVRALAHHNDRHVGDQMNILLRTALDISANDNLRLTVSREPTDQAALGTG